MKANNYTLKSLPFLEAICWNIADPYALSFQEMLAIYEGNWQFKDILAKPSQEEISFIKTLIEQYQGLPLICNVQEMDKGNLYTAITTILDYLNHDLLTKCRVYLGGGALVNLQYDRFRYSQDLDFLCSSEGFYRLRQQIADENQNILFKPNTVLKIGSPRFDRYAIRFPVYLQQDWIKTGIKVEFVVEETLLIDAAVYLEGLNIPCLNSTDLVAAKLLANYDRGLDKSKFSRDLIDLAVIRTTGILPPASFAKATLAYRLKDDSIASALTKTISQFQAQPEYRETCYQQLQIDQMVKIIDGIDLLAEDMGLELTTRTFRETDFSYLD